MLIIIIILYKMMIKNFFKFLRAARSVDQLSAFTNLPMRAANMCDGDTHTSKNLHDLGIDHVNFSLGKKLHAQPPDGKMAPFTDSYT